MTPPPFPPVEARNSLGNSSIFPSQSSITTSSSVQAGLAICNKVTEIVRACYECQINNLKGNSWAKKLKEELENIGLAYIWQSKFEINVNICRLIRERCNDIER
jgi:hypothetical protein